MDNNDGDDFGGDGVRVVEDDLDIEQTYDHQSGFDSIARNSGFDASQTAMTFKGMQIEPAI